MFLKKKSETNLLIQCGVRSSFLLFVYFKKKNYKPQKI